MKLLFIDFAMLGYHPEDCAILDCSVGTVDTDKMLSSTPYTVMDALKSTKRFKLDVVSQKEQGSIVYQDGVDFWKSQSAELVNRVTKPSPTDISVSSFTSFFVEHLISVGKVDTWWSWNSMDDAAILWRLFRMVDKEAVIREYLPRHKARDLATFIDTKFDLGRKKLDFVPIADEEYWSKVYVKVDSTAEVMANIMRMQTILRAENDMEMLNR